MNKIELKNVSKSYGTNEIFNQLQLNFQQNKIYSIIGPSGSGKTTLIRCLANIEQFDNGEVVINSDKLLKSKHKIGFVFQNFNLFENLTVLENICLAPIIVDKRNEKEVKEKAMQLLELVGLLNKSDSYVKTLSGGQKQKIAIARCLINEPEILIFDEPTSALDPESTRDILNIIKSIIVNKTTIIVTHEMEFAKNISDEIIFMENGKVVQQGSPCEIFENSNNKRTLQFINKGEQSV